MQKTKTKTLRVLWDGGFGWMEENKKSGGGDVRGEQLAIGDGNFAPRLAGSDGGFAVGWQFDKFEKFEKFVTLKKCFRALGLGSNWLLGFYVLCLLI